MEVREKKTDTQCKNSNLDSSRNENIPARYRRLKIQQDILQKGIQHLYSKLLEYDSSIGDNIKLCDSDDRSYFDEMKKKFTEIKNLYEEIRFLTDDRKVHKSSDIDEIRKNILLLETKIKESKIYLQTELDSLGKEEKTLNEHQNDTYKKAKGTKITSTTSNKLIAPSPVKVLIESPFKCLEVQQFQDFMNRTKRYGGWNEYDHNNFVQIWNTYYNDVSLDCLQEITIDMDSEINLRLIHELLEKIVGTNQEDVISHIEWYTQYLKLYTCQKNAIQKWKENRNKIRKFISANRENKEKVKTTEHGMKTKCDTNLQRSTSKCSDDSVIWDISARSQKGSEDLEGKENIQITTPYKSRLMEPTKQWLYRCSTESDTRPICNIETVYKLNVPSWRVGLQN